MELARAFGEMAPKGNGGNEQMAGCADWSSRWKY